MKRIVRNKLYDTDKATLVAKECSGYGDNLSVSLYLKKTGEWFFCCEGGFVRHPGNPRIKPTVPHEAKLWLAEYGFADEYIQYFGEPEE